MLCIAGFEDPEVMAAVNDVAQNPQNMKKYKDNKKVSATDILRITQTCAQFGSNCVVFGGSLA